MFSGVRCMIVCLFYVGLHFVLVCVVCDLCSVWDVSFSVLCVVLCTVLVVCCLV